ncbi:CotY/CotZ family spore coat protein [Sporosarcina sp. HYO08]|uniref:CotY/CotZ family spore coat protein n=1 Tax=Sporosarcina sp. HYO08 TaxID=1759557 RepID=UPI000798AB2E|nr:CotY/CotZ family spore coat protein [Sporosarcina sp. HYO08]KXH79761.1 hypothetical protein AU377_09735 [Sporosarcina sp. HYO08]
MTIFIPEKNNQCLCAALLELKAMQDFISKSPTHYFCDLLRTIVGTDTIPIVLQTKKGDFIKRIHKFDDFCCFETMFFRIEEIDEELCCAKLSLLRPLDIEGCDTNIICDVFRLQKTNVCTIIPLSCVCAVQPLDVELLKRKVIIEPKC